MHRRNIDSVLYLSRFELRTFNNQNSRPALQREVAGPWLRAGHHGARVLFLVSQCRICCCMELIPRVLSVELLLMCVEESTVFNPGVAVCCCMEQLCVAIWNSCVLLLEHACRVCMLQFESGKSGVGASHRFLANILSSGSAFRQQRCTQGSAFDSKSQRAMLLHREELDSSSRRSAAVASPSHNVCNNSSLHIVFHVVHILSSITCSMKVRCKHASPFGLSVCLATACERK